VRSSSRKESSRELATLVERLVIARKIVGKIPITSKTQRRKEAQGTRPT
jgi:hypothetical protein